MGDLTKNKGPLLQSWVNGSLNAIPEEWQARIGFYQEDQEMPLGAAPLVPVAGTVLESRLIQTRTDERKRTSLVLNPPIPNGGIVPPGGGPPDSWSMISEVRLPDGSIGTRTRSFVPDLHPADSHLVLTDDMLQAEQKNLGIGALDQEVMTTPLPGPAVISYKVDPDGWLVTVVKQRMLTASIVEGESISGTTVWLRVYAEGETANVATQVIEARLLPGPLVTSTMIEPDGLSSFLTKQKKASNAIAESESFVSGFWVKVYQEGESGVVATEVTEGKRCPGQAIPSAVIDQDGMVNTTLRTLKPVSSIFPRASIDSFGVITEVGQKEVSKLTSEEVLTTHNLLDKALYGQSREAGLPQEYRGLLITNDTSHIIQGTASQPVLATGELEHSEQQLTSLLKRKTIKAVSTLSLPSTQVGEEWTSEFGGILMNVYHILDLWGSASLDITVADMVDKYNVSNKKIPYGAYGIKELKRSQVGFPVLQGTAIDETLNFALPYTTQVIDAGYAGSTAPGSYKEVKPIDSARSLLIIGTVPAGIASFSLSFPGTTSVDLPPQLVKLTSKQANNSVSAGVYSMSGQYQIFNSGQGSMNLHCESQGSAAATYDVVPTIKQVWAQNIPCTHYLFFVAGPSVTYATVLSKVRSLAGNVVQWPKFRPEVVQISCVGKKTSGHCGADIQRHDAFIADYTGALVRSGAAAVNGAGYGFDSEVSVKTITIPPTIHTALGITGDGTSHTETFSAQSSINTNVGGKGVTVSGGATASINPTAIASTSGQNVIPTSGLFMSRMRVEPYKWGYFKCDCEVVDASNWA